jgi:neutral amino acid transport system ATP-binding protein
VSEQVGSAETTVAKGSGLLCTSDVVAGYVPEVDILNGVSIDVAEGEIVTIVGPNGAGKSTLIKTIFGLLTPRTGSISFRGTELAGKKPHDITRQGLSYVPQVDNVFPSLTVEENLEMGAVVRDDDLRPRIEEVLAIFPNLQTKRRLKAGGLSGGERQMVAMGRALMLDPRLLLLDEPSAGLSPVLVDVVFEKIEAINRGGVAILLVEQSAREALRRSHRGYLLAGGQVRLEGPGPALLENPDVARLYLGG